MMNKQTRHLERAALAAYRRGLGWNHFWQGYGADVGKCEPYNRAAYHRLVRRLMALLVSGNTDGMEPAGEPWEADDAQADQDKPADVGTRARCLLPLRPLPTADTLPASGG